MNFFEKFIYSLSTPMKTPMNYGWFHFMFIAITIATTVILCFTLAREKNDKVLKKVTFTIWIIIFIFEIYKQLVFSLNVQDGIVSWSYCWYAFPFQLCSAPLYILPLIFLLKDGKIRDNCMLFMSTFSLIGGLVTYINPNSVFVETIGINIQTMIHHGSQIIIGIFYAVYNRDRIHINSFYKYGGPILIFMILVAIAVGLNLVMPMFTSATFNMFFISPYFVIDISIFSTIYNAVPYPIFLFVYIGTFTLLAFIVHLIYCVIFNRLKLRKVKL